MKINDVQFNVELIDILQELISQLRANNIQLIQKYKDGPTHIQICCPYHANGQEHRPSAGIRKEDGVFHCFACGEVHSLQEVISHCFGHTDDIVGTFGWQWLLKNFAIVQAEERKDVILDFARNNGSDNKVVGRGYVTEDELDKYRYVHPYMYKRGLTDDIIELFDIGYDSDSKCITFPVKDIQGNCLFVARRSVVGKYFNYPAGAIKPLYGLYELYSVGLIGKYNHGYDTVKEIIVTESMLDALSFWTIGKYAVALNGIGNELQFKQLRDLTCRKIILATDNDKAGKEARKRIRQNVKNKIITEYIFPEGRKDANECTKEELKNLEEIF